MLSGVESGVTYLSYSAAVGNGPAAHTPTHIAFSLPLSHALTHTPGAEDWRTG